jgi:hypothetical protein
MSDYIYGRNRLTIHDDKSALGNDLVIANDVAFVFEQL